MDLNNKELTISLKDFWKIFLKRLWIIILAAIIVAGTKFAFDTVTYTPMYSSTATMYILRQDGEVSSSYNTAYDFSSALSVVKDCDALIKSHTVLDSTIETLGLDMTYKQLYSSVSTTNPEDTRILKVTVVADSPENAKLIVDKICIIGAETINDAMGFEQVNFFERGQENYAPANKTGLKTYIIFGLLAAVLVYAVFVVIFLLDDTIRTDEDIERYLDLTIIGDIPDGNGGRRKSSGYRYGYIQTYDTSDDAENKEE
ncbi:MAG: Wzz/FepE/Etk N-terminal domain-containing protein [Acutalibacteraceae bacterium]|nr:Wzz/FepE/Etk N-terminal domain-containing protein [Acutalibacteraceae bacterium]